MVKSKFRDDKPYVYFTIFFTPFICCMSSARVIKSLALLAKFSEKSQIKGNGQLNSVLLRGVLSG
jgi:hypothetical protein